MKEIRVPAIEVDQGKNKVYSFAVDGKLIDHFASVSRISRNDEDRELAGYQRPEVKAHITEIREYLETANAMVPNSLVIAFDSRVTFEPIPQTTLDQWSSSAYARHGWLVIPFVENDGEKPGWIVDGQQRSAAVRAAEVNQFPLCVTSFITSDVETQREQFILVNATKPLPTGLIYELLPGTQTRLPLKFERKRFSAVLLEKLNHADPNGPLFEKIKTSTVPEGEIKDNSMLKMLSGSLSDGVLYRWRDPKTGTGDVEPMLEVLNNYWGAVAEVFPKAWNLPARKSRLVHGTGICAMGFVMDAIADRYELMENKEIPSQNDFKADLLPLASICQWTEGVWDFGEEDKRKWNDLQNLSKDIHLLTNYLLKAYQSLVWNPAKQALNEAS